MTREINNNTEIPQFQAQADQIKGAYSGLKSHEKKVAATVILVIALLAAAGIASGVGVLTTLPAVPSMAGYGLIGASAAGGIGGGAATFLIGKQNLSKLNSREKNALSEEVDYQPLMRAMYDSNVTTEIISQKLAEYTPEEFGLFYDLINDESDQDNPPEKFIDAFAQNASRFTDEQIEGMNYDFADRINQSESLPEGEVRFGMQKYAAELNKGYDTTQTAEILSRLPEEQFAEFVQFIDQVWSREKIVDALAMQETQKFSNELVENTSERLCAEIAESVHSNEEQKVRFTLWRTLAEMGKMTDAQILDRITSYSRLQFGEFIGYIYEVGTEQVPESVMRALVDRSIKGKWVAYRSRSFSPETVYKMWTASLDKDPLLNPLLQSNEIFRANLVMGLYGKLPIEAQESIRAKLKNGKREEFDLAHLLYLNQELSSANVTSGRIDDKVFNTAVVRHLLDANYTFRAGVANFQKLVREKDKHASTFGNFSPSFIMKLLELSVAISNCTDTERLRSYPGFKNLRKEFPKELVATLSNEQVQVLHHISGAYVAAEALGKRVVSSHLRVLYGLLDDRAPSGPRVPGVEYL